MTCVNLNGMNVVVVQGRLMDRFFARAQDSFLRNQFSCLQLGALTAS